MGKHICIVGGGAAGLAASREVMRAGHTPHVFEKSGAIGGIWVYQPDTAGEIKSALYASLRTNLPRDIMAFMDFTFDSSGGGDDNWPRYPHHTCVRQYLEAYARHFGLVSHIQLTSAVEKVERADSGSWLLTVRDTNSSETRKTTFDAVMVCNGHYSVPRLPPLPGKELFRGEILHSNQYRDPAPFTGKRVALWGTAASGTDISLEVAKHAAAVFWCGDTFAAAPWGREIASGARIFPSPEKFTEEGLQFAGGKTLPVDTFIYCTGYGYSFPFLASDVVRVDDNWVYPLYQDIVSPAQPTLGFVGLPYLIVPFPLFEIQARWFVATLDGAIELPDANAMLGAIHTHRDQLLAEGVPQRHFHKLGDKQTAYYNRLARDLGEPPLPTWFSDLASEAQASRLADPIGFRDKPLVTRGRTVVPLTPKSPES